MGIISVLGAGSWGTALAVLLARNGHRCVLWGHEPEHMRRLATARINAHYLPNVEFPKGLDICSNLSSAVDGAEVLLLAIPSHAFQSLLRTIAPYLGPRTGVAWATKGLEITSGRLLHEVVADELGSDRRAAVLSGPTFAGEVAAGLPSAITVASTHEEFAKQLATLLHNNVFRAYTCDDMIGVQLGGSTKNVLAIAAGVSDGLGFGANARAALITRGLTELMRLGLAMGGKAETLMGLSGLGDLILTATDNQSRNRRFGLGLGEGKTTAQIIAAIGQEIEGLITTKLIYRLARQRGIDMPITEQVYRILYEDLPPIDAVRNLLLRERKAEALSYPGHHPDDRGAAPVNAH